jgi:hypothetical protein
MPGPRQRLSLVPKGRLRISGFDLAKLLPDFRGPLVSAKIELDVLGEPAAGSGTNAGNRSLLL